MASLMSPCVPKFSGSSAEQLRKAYSEFCSKHTKAVKEYKDLLARDKRFQQFIRVSINVPIPDPPLCPHCFIPIPASLAHPCVPIGHC